MRASALLLAAVLAAIPAPPASAQQPTEVAVLFELRDSRFRDRFGPAAPAVERLIADSIAAALADRVGFVRMVPGGGSPHALAFTLDRRDRQSSAAFPERGIWARLDAPGQAGSEFYWMTLRPAEAALTAVGTDTALAMEVARLFRGDLTALHDRLLSEVPISRDGLVWNSPLGWVLPFSRSDLCMRNQTRLAFVNDVPVGAMRVERIDTAAVTSDFAVSTPLDPLHARYLHRVFSEPDRNRAMDPDLRQALLARTAVVRAVYVVEYELEAPCRPQPLAPTIGGGGDR